MLTVCLFRAGVIGCFILCAVLGLCEGLTLYVLSKFAERYDAHTYSLLVGPYCPPLLPLSFSLPPLVASTGTLMRRATTECILWITHHSSYRLCINIGILDTHMHHQSLDIDILHPSTIKCHKSCHTFAPTRGSPARARAVCGEPDRTPAQHT